MKKYVTLAALLLSGCASQWDMQGNDPKDYYAEHPVKNTVETRTASHTLHFVGDRVSEDELDALRADLNAVTPSAAQKVKVSLNPLQLDNEARKQRLTKTLVGMGYARKTVSFVAQKGMGSNDAKLDITYSAVISPRCPDWRMSPVTTYSNTAHNIGCATTANLGLMVADPQDLVRGQDDGAYDSQRTSTTMDQYNGGKDMSQTAAAPASGSSAASTTTAGAQ